MGLKHEPVAESLKISCPQKVPRQLMAGAKRHTLCDGDTVGTPWSQWGLQEGWHRGWMWAGVWHPAPARGVTARSGFPEHQLSIKIHIHSQYKSNLNVSQEDKFSKKAQQRGLREVEMICQQKSQC